MNKHWLIAGGLAIALGWSALGAAVTPAFAQDGSAGDAEEEDIIVVTGGRMDRGMKAFMDGDYEQAEVEFKLNLECAERERMLMEFSIEQSYQDGISDEVSAAAGAGLGSRNGGFGGSGITIYQTPQETSTYYRGNPRNPDEIKDRTCEDSPWQLYMIGMSQIQQGKYDEAKRNFYKVINTSRNPLLFDAHYRIALLEIMDGNLDKAEDRLKTLKVLQARCVRRGERCEFREEIDELVAYLEPALDKAVSEARAS